MGHNFSFHISFVQKGANLVQVLHFFGVKDLFTHMFTHAQCLLALTLWDTIDKEARLFPWGGHFDRVRNGNN